MLEHIPALGARFDLKKVGSEQNCWQIFWRAVRPREIAGASLYEGSIHRDDYCIAVQISDPAVVEKVRHALTNCVEFLDACCPDPFIEGDDCISAPLPRTGRIDSEGNLIGDDKRMSNQVTAPVAAPENPVSLDVMDSASPMRHHPASERTAHLPDADSLEDLVAMLKYRFVVHQAGFDRDIWIMPKELCDVVEWYAPIISVGLSFHATEYADTALRVRLFDKIHPEEEPFVLEGFYIFKTRYAVTSYLQQFISTPRYADALPDLAGIVGRFHLHFTDPRIENRSEDYSEEQRIAADQLWPNLLVIRKTFGDELVRALDVLARRREAEARPPSHDVVVERTGAFVEPDPEPLPKPKGLTEEEKQARAEARRIQEEENERRRAEVAKEMQIQENRRTEGRCIYCGKPLGFGEKRKQLDRHKDCWEFVPDYAKTSD